MTININRVYTRSGDKGKTGLVDGSRIKKNSLRADAIGELDELNTALGIVSSKIEAIVVRELAQNSTSKNEIFELLQGVVVYLQQELFDLGAEVATPDPKVFPNLWTVKAKHITHLEEMCDYFNSYLPDLSSFILPGGSELSSQFHLARAIARRAERSLVELYIAESNDSKSEDSHIIPYINRLSDLLFVLSRYALVIEDKKEVLWVIESARRSPLK